MACYFQVLRHGRKNPHLSLSVLVDAKRPDIFSSSFSFFLWKKWNGKVNSSLFILTTNDNHTTITNCLSVTYYDAFIYFCWSPSDKFMVISHRAHVFLDKKYIACVLGARKGKTKRKLFLIWVRKKMSSSRVVYEATFHHFSLTKFF